MFKKVYSLYSAFCTQPAFYSQSAVNRTLKFRLIILWSVIRVKYRKQIMLWCLIFHSAELQNYVPALHGIMFQGDRVSMNERLIYDAPVKSSKRI